MSTYQTSGIILKTTDRGEADQLFNIYTKSAGKITALGRATKKIKSKLNGPLRHFAVVNIMVASGRNFDHIASAEISRNFPGILGDLKKIVYASYALEVVDGLTKNNLADENIYNLLVNYLAAIDANNYSENQWKVIKRAFIAKLLSYLGFAPDPETAKDGKKLEKLLSEHLEKPLETEKFLAKMHP